jgi:hypothetical protein
VCVRCPVFKFDPKYLENEERYKSIKAEILLVVTVKISMRNRVEGMGLKTLAERFKDPEVKRGCKAMFPMDMPKNTRFAINYFTSIGLRRR